MCTNWDMIGYCYAYILFQYVVGGHYKGSLTPATNSLGRAFSLRNVRERHSFHTKTHTHMQCIIFFRAYIVLTWFMLTWFMLDSYEVHLGA